MKKWPTYITIYNNSDRDQYEFMAKIEIPINLYVFQSDSRFRIHMSASRSRVHMALQGKIELCQGHFWPKSKFWSKLNSNGPFGLKIGVPGPFLAGRGRLWSNLVKNISRTHVQPFSFSLMVKYVILFLTDHSPSFDLKFFQ